MLGLTLMVALTAAPLKVGVPEFRGVNVSDQTISFYSEHFAQNLRTNGLTVVTSREIAAIIGMERQKQLLGCDEGNSCLAELANALGADAIVLGDLGRFGNTFQANVKVLSASNGQVLAMGSQRVDGEVKVLDALAQLGRALSRAVFEESGRARTALARPSLRSWAWVPLVSGGLLAGGGAMLFGLARADHAALTGMGEPLSDAAAIALRDGGFAKQTAGVVGMAVGVAGLGLGLAFLLLGAPVEAVVALTPLEGGVMISRAWMF